MFLPGPDSRRWIKQRLEQGWDGTLAVAFWGNGAIAQLGLDKLRPNQRVRIVCNLKMGGTNPDEIAALRKLVGITVVQSDKLHGKVYLIGKEVCIGSSNASANGLSFEGRDAAGWDEASFASSDIEVVRDAADWINSLTTRVVTPADLALARKAWRARRSAATTWPSRRSIRDVLSDPAAALKGRNIVLALYASDYDAAGEAMHEQAKLDFGPAANGFQNWPKLPKDATLLCFWREANGRLRYDGCFRRDPQVTDIIKGKQSFQICFPEKDTPLGLKHPNQDRRAWRDVVDRTFTNFEALYDGDGLFVDLSALR